MWQILAEYTTSISELKKNPMAIINEAENASIAILNHNKPAAYLVPAQAYARLMELFEDHELGEIVKTRQSERNKAVEVNLDDL